MCAQSTASPPANRGYSGSCPAAVLPGPLEAARRRGVSERGAHGIEGATARAGAGRRPAARWSATSSASHQSSSSTGSRAARTSSSAPGSVLDPPRAGRPRATVLRGLSGTKARRCGARKQARRRSRTGSAATHGGPAVDGPRRELGDHRRRRHDRSRTCMQTVTRSSSRRVAAGPSASRPAPPGVPTAWAGRAGGRGRSRCQDRGGPARRKARAGRQANVGRDGCPLSTVGAARSRAVRRSAPRSHAVELAAERERVGDGGPGGERSTRAGSAGVEHEGLVGVGNEDEERTRPGGRRRRSALAVRLDVGPPPRPPPRRPGVVEAETDQVDADERRRGGGTSWVVATRSLPMATARRSRGGSATARSGRKAGRRAAASPTPRYWVASADPAEAAARATRPAT